MSSRVVSTTSPTKKLLIATVAGISVGIVSYFLWKHKNPEIEEIQNLNVSQIDDTQPLKIVEEKLPENCEFISVIDLKNLIKSQSSNFVIFDVRSKSADYSGGHINNSINIPDTQFYDSVESLIKKYNNKAEVVTYCMYGARRSVKCIEFYSKAISELIANYSKETQTSHFFLYHVRATANLQKKGDEKSSDAEDDSSIHLLYGGKYGWLDENVTKKRVDMDCNDEFIQNLSKQKLYVLKGGFFLFLNELMNDGKRDNVITDFDEDKYEQLELRGLFEKQMWYHINEYFAKSKFIQLKGSTKSARFKLNSSTKNIKHRF